MVERKKTRQIQLGRVAIGGDAPISLQSMTTTKTADINATLQQIASRHQGYASLRDCAGSLVAQQLTDQAEVDRVLGKES